MENIIYDLLILTSILNVNKREFIGELNGLYQLLDLILGKSEHLCELLELSSTKFPIKIDICIDHPLHEREWAGINICVHLYTFQYTCIYLYVFVYVCIYFIYICIYL